MAPPGIGRSVEGVHAVTAALEAGRVETLFVERGRASALGDLIESAREAGVPVEEVGDIGARAVTQAPQGVLARCRPIEPIRLEEAVAAGELPAIVVLDHLEDPRNVGAVARSAVAAGFDSLVTSTTRAAPLDATAFKAAAGALERLSIVAVSSVAAAITDLKRLDVWTVGLDADGDTSIFGLDLLRRPVAIAVGGEGGGLSRLVGERVDVVASIPMAGRVESLNASVAAALALFEVARMRGG
jgi:23S rRNA (guanosine2251-2'-O)-methyltransferase